ncbi:hypothetical protein GCM10025859_42040 [Alicyclobacillus fastidiosus]|nr:hypothetical protein GCM10025859_42040 [Alicyclobacillus fastidiosus]
MTHNDIRGMLQELRSGSLLQGVRGRTGADLDRLVDVIYQIAQVAVCHAEQLRALEVNPLWVRGSHVEALDALVSIEN